MDLDLVGRIEVDPISGIVVGPQQGGEPILWMEQAQQGSWRDHRLPSWKHPGPFPSWKTRRAILEEQFQSNKISAATCDHNFRPKCPAQIVRAVHGA
jgi:hypothetical protein